MCAIAASCGRKLYDEFVFGEEARKKKGSAAGKDGEGVRLSSFHPFFRNFSELVGIKLGKQNLSLHLPVEYG